MTRRDMAWRAGGFVISLTASIGCLLTDGSPLTALLFPFVFGGLPLMLHGKRVGQMFRAERSGHRHTADAVHAARLRRRNPKT